MNKKLIILIFLLFIGNLLFAQTKVVKTSNGFELQRNGKPYYIKGVGGDVNMEKIVAIGANSIRTWGVERAQEVLDEAERNGLTVMLGLWVQHERHGFDYNNQEKVAKQLAYFKTVIDRFKNHPALLIWGVGNEVDLNYTNPNVWNAIQDIAKYIHQSDPNHPTTTVTAGLDSLEVAFITARCPDIDIYSINTYGDIGNVPNHIAKFGWNGPYMITEWGPNGHWESPQTKWGVSIEQNSTEKKEVYFNRYKNYIEKNTNICLGSYAFLWGAKQEYTETWYGLFSKNNIPTEPIDALEEVFTGKALINPAPTIIDFHINQLKAIDNIELKSSGIFDANINIQLAGNANMEKANYHWRIMEESTDKKSGGDMEDAATELPGLIKKTAQKNLVKFRAPQNVGAYRLFVSVTYQNKMAYANIPFKVIARGANEPQGKFIEFKYTDMNNFNE
jgi:hypothetical protein